MSGYFANALTAVTSRLPSLSSQTDQALCLTCVERASSTNTALKSDQLFLSLKHVLMKEAAACVDEQGKINQELFQAKLKDIHRQLGDVVAAFASAVLDHQEPKEYKQNGTTAAAGAKKLAPTPRPLPTPGPTPEAASGNASADHSAGAGATPAVNAQRTSTSSDSLS